MKKLLSIILALVMVLGLCVIPTWAAPVTYMNWNAAENKLVETSLAEGITPESVADVTGNVTWNDTTEKWYIVERTVTISGTLTVTGTVNLIIKDGCKLTVEKGIKINSGGSLTIYGQTNKTGELIVKGECLNGTNRIGIYAQGSLTANGITVNAAGGDARVSDSRSYGINAEGKVTFNDCAVTAIAGKGYFSNGIYAGSAFTINGGTVNATGDESPWSSAGIYADSAFTINGGKVTATGGKVTNANTPLGSFGVGSGTATLTSGTLIAKGDTASTNGDKVKALNSAPTLPTTTTYWWRTAETGDFTEFTDDTTAYVNGTNTYAEITTIEPVVTPPADQEPAPAPEPDEEPTAPGHEPIRRQHITATVEDTAPDTDTKADESKTDTVTSAKTFDTGVAVYGALAVASLLGMGYVGKKRV